MKAAVVHSFDQPLSPEDVPVREPGPEQVLCGWRRADGVAPIFTLPAASGR